MVLSSPTDARIDERQERGRHALLCTQRLRGPFPPRVTSVWLDIRHPAANGFYFRLEPSSTYQHVNEAHLLANLWSLTIAILTVSPLM